MISINTENMTEKVINQNNYYTSNSIEILKICHANKLGNFLNPVFKNTTLTSQIISTGSFFFDVCIALYFKSILISSLAFFGFSFFMVVALHAFKNIKNFFSVNRLLIKIQRTHNLNSEKNTEELNKIIIESIADTIFKQSVKNFLEDKRDFIPSNRLQENIMMKLCRKERQEVVGSEFKKDIVVESVDCMNEINVFNF